MSTYYVRLMQLLTKWTVDKSKIGRDLGEHLQNQANTIIKPSSVPTKLSGKLIRQIEALERIANNVHGKNFVRTSKSTSTGLTAEQCHQVLTSDFLKYLNDSSKVKIKS